MITQMLRVYVAAPWIDREMAAATAERIRGLGCFITKAWWETPDVPMPSGLTDPAHIPNLRQQALDDLEGVITADVVVVFSAVSASGGKEVETGCALGAGIPVILIGEPRNIFHTLETVTIVPTVEKALNELAWMLMARGQGEIARGQFPRREDYQWVRARVD